MAVYPEMKWYIACAVVSLLTGGSTPKASQHSRMMFFGCGPMHGMRALAMKSIGYDARVFSVTALRQAVHVTRSVMARVYRQQCMNELSHASRQAIAARIAASAVHTDGNPPTPH